MKRLLVFCFVFLIIVSLAFIRFGPKNIISSLSSSFERNRVVTITDLAGDVKVVTSNGSKTIKAFKNMKLSQGDRLLCGEKAWVSLTIDTDKDVLVSENTSLSIEELSGSDNDVKTLLTVEAGKVWSNIKEKIKGNSKYEIKTPTATMGVRGTKFYVDASQEMTRLAVLDGTVAIATKIITKDPEGKTKVEEVSIIINKDKQISVEKDQVTTKEELGNKIKAVDMSSLDINTLKFIQKDPAGLDPEINKEIDQLLGYKQIEATLIQENKVQIKGSVLLPDGKRNIEGGHIHIRNSKNIWVYYGLLDTNGDFVAGDLADGSYWLRSDPALFDEYVRSSEVPIVISNGKANPDVISLQLNNIQLSGTIVNPEGLPVAEGHLYISDSGGNWIYYAEIENGINKINVGGLRDDSYTIIAYPASNSEFVPSDARQFTIKNGKADASSIKLKLNTPQLSGTVLLADGKTGAAGGHIHVRDEKAKWVQYVNLDANAGFRIGGLKDGKYWLRADSSEEPGYVSSKEFELEIVDGKAKPASAQLILSK